MRKAGALLLTIGCFVSIACLLAQFLTARNSKRLAKSVQAAPLDEVTTRATALKTTTEATSTSKNFVYLKEPRSKFLRTDSKRCAGKQGALWRMAIFVKTTARFFHRRELFRRTWASFSCVDGLAMQIIFVVGNSDRRRSSLIDEEFERYNDLLQYSGPDDYRNIPLKSLAAMSWASDNLPEDVFFSSMDDDVMVDVAELVKALRASNRTMLRYDWPEYPIVCMYRHWGNAKPYRNPASKYFISEEEYRWPTWPKFCLGGMYTMSGAVVRQLWEVSKTQVPLRMDDVWITGVLREKLGMPADMVVRPDRAVATHWRGYGGQASKNIRGFMQDEWRKLAANLENSSLSFADDNRSDAV